MFENLKAFIRHGKQANEMRKDNYEPMDQTYRKNHDVQHLDKDGKPHKAPESNGRDPIATQEIEQNNHEENNYKVDNANQVNGTSKHDQDTYANKRYEQAAQIVEQEKLQRKTSLKYPMLDNYEIMEQMGEGAFSIVCKGVNRTTKELVAIKILRKFQMDQAQKQAVLKEAAIMRRLDHSNIIKFVEFIDLEPYYYIIQEIATGGEIFSAIVKYTYLSEDLSRHVITQVADAVRYLHEEAGIVHRDIKPENLLYDPIDFVPSLNPVAKLRRSDDPKTKRDEGEFIPAVGGGGIGVVKLADFGLSKQVWELNTKTPCGTVGYTAPEIVRDERYSKEVDMWAIGCVLYTLLCGFPPFYDESIEVLTEKVSRGDYTFLSPWWDEISEGARNCVSKLLTVNPQQRYNINDLLEDPWLNNRPTNVLSSEHLSTKAPRSKKNYNKQNFNDDIYSPAAVALRDAFDVSTAVHRMGEEAALYSKAVPMQDLAEEDEEEDDLSDADLQKLTQATDHKFVDKLNHNYERDHQRKKNPSPIFDLNLNTASIIERRKHKGVPV